MATRSSTTKTKLENQNLTRSRSVGRKPKPVAPSSETEAKEDGFDKKSNEKPLPNYLKPTISSRADPVKFLKKTNVLEDNQKFLRNRSFDRLPTSLTSSSARKSLDIPPRDKPMVPREKPVAGLRSASFHGPRGINMVKMPPVASKGTPSAKKSGQSSSSKNKKEEIAKVETYEQVSDHGEVVNEDETEDKTVVLEMKETVNVEESKEEEESLTKDIVEEVTKREVVERKRGSSIDYNDIIASEMQENMKKNNRVLALAGAFQTVIDHASK